MPLGGTVIPLIYTFDVSQPTEIGIDLDRVQGAI